MGLKHALLPVLLLTSTGAGALLVSTPAFAAQYATAPKPAQFTTMSI